MRMPRFRFTVRRMMVWVAVAGGTIGCMELVLVRPVRTRMADRDWFRRVEADYKILAQKRPPGVPRGQWEYLVGWTRNLHSNRGPFLRDRGRASRFMAELEDRLRGPV